MIRGCCAVVVEENIYSEFLHSGNSLLQPDSAGLRKSVMYNYHIL